MLHYLQENLSSEPASIFAIRKKEQPSYSISVNAYLN